MLAGASLASAELAEEAVDDLLRRRHRCCHATLLEEAAAGEGGRGGRRGREEREGGEGGGGNEEEGRARLDVLVVVDGCGEELLHESDVVEERAETRNLRPRQRDHLAGEAIRVGT